MQRRGKMKRRSKDEIQRLPLTFTWKGFVFKQIKRHGKAAMYEQILDGKRVAIEVVRFKVKEPDAYHETKWEMYPGQSSWGRRGKTFMPHLQMKKAEEQYNRWKR
ncbi:MAG TPA: hypothetical protein DDX98_01220 [Bacteroidales bacterium]|nr:hypothetical protein [Bacteroidales bacterium]